MRISNGLTAALLASALPVTPALAQTTYLLCTTEDGEERYYSFGPNEFRTYSKRTGWFDNVCTREIEGSNDRIFGECRISPDEVEAFLTTQIFGGGQMSEKIVLTFSQRYYINRLTGYFENENANDLKTRNKADRAHATKGGSSESGTCEPAENPAAAAKF